MNRKASSAAAPSTTGADTRADRAEHRCPNCGAAAPGAYCPACGQETRDELPTFMQFAREATGRYVSYDGKLWKTLGALFFRPGFLTQVYLAGRRRRYIGPARLFLVSSLVLFAALRFATESFDVIEALDIHVDTPADAQPSSGELLHLDESLNIELGGLSDSIKALRKRTDRFNKLSRSQKADQILAGTLRYGPYAMFALLPAFAALLKIVYLGRGRRYPSRPRLYGEHLVFAAHTHAFLFIIGTAIVAVPWGGARNALASWAALYLIWSMRVVYRGSWLGTVARGLALLLAYFLLFILVTAGLLVAAILLR